MVIIAGNCTARQPREVNGARTLIKGGREVGDWPYLMAPIAWMKVRVLVMEEGEAFSWLRDWRRCRITCSNSCCWQLEHR